MSWVDGDAISVKITGGIDNETGVIVQGRKFFMPRQLPLAFPVYLQREDVAGALRCLFGQDWEVLLDLAGADLSVDWLREVVEQTYGDSVGEASASPLGSSPMTGDEQRPRPISAASTD